MIGIHIAILVDSYSENGGASKSIRDCVKTLTQRGYSVHILCSRYSCLKMAENVQIVRTRQDIIKALTDYDKCVVVFFKAAKSLIDKSIFKKFTDIKEHFNKETRVITVVCQQPSNPNTILMPYEIEKSDHLIFIDKTAFNDPLYSFIPKERKSWTYLTIPDDGPNPLDQYVKTDYALKDGEVVFGRGSSFNKCPKNILEPFDRLNVTCKKRFVIVGVPNRKNWLKAKITKRVGNDVVTFPLMGFDEWMNQVRSFDIGLYCLPKNAHSSIDGTLGQMMRIGLPVIVGGAPAPKERIIHGENGFIADTVPEIVHYAEMLVNNQELRETIGKNARKSAIALNSNSWIDRLEMVMEKLCVNRTTAPIHIPLSTRLKIDAIYCCSVIRAWFVRPIDKLLTRLCRL